MKYIIELNKEEFEFLEISLFQEYKGLKKINAPEEALEIASNTINALKGAKIER